MYVIVITNTSYSVLVYTLNMLVSLTNNITYCEIFGCFDHFVCITVKYFIQVKYEIIWNIVEGMCGCGVLSVVEVFGEWG